MALTKNINQKGQALVEFILILVVMLGASRVLFKALKDMNYVNRLTVNVWAKASGMVECGVWEKCGITASKSGGGSKNHPGNRPASYIDTTTR